MSYDLWFWRQTKSLDLSFSQICETLEEPGKLDGIETLPIDRIQREPCWRSFRNDSYFQVSWPASASHVMVNCGYRLLDNPQPLNRLIDVLGKFGCALYDPQTGERYQQPDVSPGEL